jgi:porin
MNETKNSGRPRNIFGAVCLSAASSIFAGTFTPASAQNANPYAPTQSPSAQSVPQASPPPLGQPPSTPPPDMGPIAQLHAWGTSLGKTLADDGIYLSGSYTEDMSSLVSGGLKTGTIPSGEFSFGATFDLQKILGIPEGSFHVIFDERSGFGLSNGNVGDSAGLIEGGIGPTRATRLSEAYYEQGFFNDRIDIQFGRTNPTQNFLTGNLSTQCSFVGGIICAQPASFYFSNASEAFPASTWGAFVNFQTTPHTYLRTGVYDDDPSQLLGNQQGFNFNVKGSTGVFLPLEIGYQTSFSDARYPGKYDVGGYWDDANYTTPAGVPMRGRTAYYAQAEQTVWRPNPQTDQSLTVFGGGIIYTGGAPYWGQAYAGATDRAPFGAVRPDDSIGIVGSYFANSANQHPNAPSMWVYEVNYKFQVVPGLTVKPFTQYVVAPNNLLDQFGTKEPSNSWVVGFQASIDFGAFLGFPQFVAY